VELQEKGFKARELSFLVLAKKKFEFKYTGFSKDLTDVRLLPDLAV